MSEPLTDVDARTAFGRLRAAELSALRPPDVSTVRGTVRRRRRRRTAVGGGVAAGLLLAGGVYGNVALPPQVAPAGSRWAADDSREPAEDAWQLLNNVMVGGPYNGEERAVKGYSAGDEPVSLGPATAESIYRVALACVGTGTVRATFTVGTLASTWQHTCGPAKGRPSQSADLGPVRPGESMLLTLSIDTPDGDPVGWAYQLRWSKTLRSVQKR